MPIYEYRCAGCGRKSQVITLSVKTAVAPVCPHCGGSDLRKLVSRVAVLRSEESRLESLADPSALGGVDENDPRSVARWMKKMGREMGEDLGGDLDGEVDKALEGSERGGEGGEGPAGGSGEADDGL